MFVVGPQPGEVDLRRLRRKPAGADRMALQGWLFLPETRPWDADDREAIARATGLYALTPTGWMHESDDWFKSFARSYCRTSDLDHVVGECVGIGADGNDT